jgi:iron(III) transport system substrate-binding protein
MRTVSIAALCVAWAGVGHAQSAEQSADAACTAAANEPTLVWYSSQDVSRNDAAAAAFSEAYPDIDVEYFRLSTGQLTTRYASERDAGVINADIISLADPNFIAAGAADGWWTPIGTDILPILSDLDPSWIENDAVTTSISLLGFAFNTDEVGSTPPQTWQDLLDPDYEGRIILGDPRSVPSYMALFRILREELGDEFLTGLAAQNPIVVPSVVPGTQQLAAGEVAIVVPNVMTVVRVLTAEGAPIEFVAPDLTTGNEFETVLSAGADSPNAALCMMAFLLSQPGQIAYNGPTSVSPFDGTPDTATMPPDYIEPRIPEVGEHSAAIIDLLGLE